jgi:hypothetical protein
MAVAVRSSARNVEVHVNSVYGGSAAGRASGSAGWYAARVPLVSAPSPGAPLVLVVKLGGGPGAASTVRVRRLALVCRAEATPAAAIAAHVLPVSAIDLTAVRALVDGTGLPLAPGAQTLLAALDRAAAGADVTDAQPPTSLASMLATLAAAKPALPVPAPAPPVPSWPTAAVPPPRPSPPPSSAGMLVPPMFRGVVDALEQHLLAQVQARLDALQAHVDMRLDRLEALLARTHPPAL